MKTWFLVLAILWPDGTREWGVEDGFRSRAACEDRAMAVWQMTTARGASQVEVSCNANVDLP